MIFFHTAVRQLTRQDMKLFEIKKSLLQAPDFVTARYGGVMYLIGY
jgi:hypothetical protein